jgi:hypothetical protein
MSLPTIRHWTPPKQYRCVYCGETKPGRFRPARRASGWTQHMTKPVWICRPCDEAQGTAGDNESAAR